MKQNILFLVHVEEAFRYLFPDPMYPLRIKRACLSRKYDEVIALESNIDTNNVLIHELDEVFGVRKIEWGWGYEKGMFDDEENKWVIPTSSPHETTWVLPELREMQTRLQHMNVFVGGGCETECLQGFVDCLSYLDINYKKVSGYIF